MTNQDQVNEYVIELGDRIYEWIETSLTFENGCKRLPYDDEPPYAWFFTQKGQRLYDSYIRRAEKMISKKFPDELPTERLECWTGVYYP